LRREWDTEDLIACWTLSPLFWTHVNPYGRFVLDIDSRLGLASVPKAPSVEPQGEPVL
jgi:hypothetical protein